MTSKLLYSIIALALVASSYGYYQYAQADIYGSSLIGWWTLDSNHLINNATDSSGNGYNGDLVGFTSTSSAEVAGVLGQALSFNGSSQRVQIPAFNKTLLPITVTEWIKSNANQHTFTGLTYWRAVTGAPGLGLGYGGTGITNQLGYEWNGTEYDWSSGLIVPNGVWTFVALEVTSAGGTIYMDSGSGMKSASHAVSETAIDFANVGDIATDSGYISTRSFNGSIDDVRVYSTALTASEVATLYYAGISQHMNGAF